jgi:hypothetical protein
MEKIEPKLLEGPPVKVGKLGKKDVFQYKTKGGLYMVGVPKVGGMEILGSGPHRAVARIVAEKNTEKKNEEALEWTELSKSDHVPPEHYAFILPEYEELTERMRKLNGDN